MRCLALLGVVALFRVCGRGAPVFGTPLGGEHGGAVAVSAGLTTEVAALPDGRIAAYIRGPQNAPITRGEVQLSLRRPDGQLQSVPVHYDTAMQAYVGRAAGIQPGPYPAEVLVRPVPGMPPIQMVTPPVLVMVATPVPQARYGGSVQVLGDHAVEIVPASAGEVALFWMDLDGTPIPSAEVVVPSISVVSNGRAHVAPVQLVNGYHIARSSAFAAPEVEVSVPVLMIRGVPYQRVVVPSVRVVALLPAVVVGAMVVQPAPTIVLGGQAPRGRSVGFWGNRGVIVGGPFIDRGDDDDDDDRGHGRGHAYGHGNHGGGGNGHGHGGGHGHR